MVPLIEYLVRLLFQKKCYYLTSKADLTVNIVLILGPAHPSDTATTSRAYLPQSRYGAYIHHGKSFRAFYSFPTIYALSTV